MQASLSKILYRLNLRERNLTLRFKFAQWYKVTLFLKMLELERIKHQEAYPLRSYTPNDYRNEANFDLQESQQSP